MLSARCPADEAWTEEAARRRAHAYPNVQQDRDIERAADQPAADGADQRANATPNRQWNGTKGRTIRMFGHVIAPCGEAARDAVDPCAVAV